MRRLAAIAVCVGLLFALAEQPFSHTHLHESVHAKTSHAGIGFKSHTHFGSLHHHDETEFRAEPDEHDGDDAVFLNSAQDNPRFAPVVFVLSEHPDLQNSPDQKPAWESIPSTRSHDPPDICSSSPRSPPA